jgi:hypothetical protein
MDDMAMQQDFGAGGTIGGLIYLAIIILSIAGLWKTFAKAGQPGWAAIIPIYNVVVMLRIGGQPLWFLVLFLIPLANIFAAFATMFGIARAFGKGVGFGVGLTLLGFIFFPILGFGDARFVGAPQKMPQAA